jgi:predicted unusual protein kinase regulating ubiquinone biosynthesis (AarF/ABC1/UbiB family)
MVGRVTPGMQENLLRLLLAISEGKGEEVVEIVLQISQASEDFDKVAFRTKAGQLVAEQQGQSLAQENVGQALLETVKVAADSGLYVPSELTILGKTLLQLEQIGRILSPTFKPNESVRRNVGSIMQRRMLKSASPAKLFASLLEMKDFVGGLPGRVNKLLDAAANAELQVNVKTPDAHHLLAGFEKIANRITMGVILASLIIGASLLMRVDSSWRIFGYPGLAILCFVAALGGSVWLVFGILIKDWRDKRKRKD